MRIRINPVYGKELKMKVRSVKFALTIFLFNMMLGIVAITGFEVMFNMHLNPYVDYSGAAKVFYILVSMEILTVMFLIPSFTAGSIAGEPEKQTLDILLTTTLTPGEIIMGKLMSSISMVFLLVKSSNHINSLYHRWYRNGRYAYVYVRDIDNIIFYRKYGDARIYYAEKNGSGYSVFICTDSACLWWNGSCSHSRIHSSKIVLL